MHERRTTLALGLLLAAAALAATASRPLSAFSRGQEADRWQEHLEAWKYPGAIVGASSMGSGGNSSFGTMKIQSKFSTPDAFEAVAKFYADKAGVADGPRRNGAHAKQAGAASKAASVQDDSDGRPVQVRVYTVNEAEASTVVVLSRATEEKQTHITWSQYRKYDKKP